LVEYILLQYIFYINKLLVYYNNFILTEIIIIFMIYTFIKGLLLTALLELI